MEDGAINYFSIFDITLANIARESIPKALDDSMANKRTTVVIFASWWDIMRSRWNRKWRKTLRKADWVIPTSRSLQSAAHFLGEDSVARHIPFDFIIMALSHLERIEASLYILGLAIHNVNHIENNIRETFPRIRTVGRYAGHFARNVEANVVTAIKKASPTIVVAGAGLPGGGGDWFLRRRSAFSGSILIWSNSAMEVFASIRKRPSRKLFNSLFGFMPGAALHPWRIFRAPFFILFLLYLLLKKIFRKPVKLSA